MITEKFIITFWGLCCVGGILFVAIKWPQELLKSLKFENKGAFDEVMSAVVWVTFVGGLVLIVYPWCLL